MVLGTRCFHHILDVVQRVQHGERPIVATELSDDPSSTREGVGQGRSQLRAFVPIILGCTNFCSYCIVPYVRGKETSRPQAEVVREIRQLVQHGHARSDAARPERARLWQGPREPASFEGLLEDLNDPDLFSDLEDLWRIRFMTSHPRDAGPALVQAFVDLPNVCEHLHLPLQAGTNRLLQEMRRGYTVEAYVDLVARLPRGRARSLPHHRSDGGLPRARRSRTSRRAWPSTSSSASMPPSPSPIPPAPAPTPRARADQVPRRVTIARLERLIEAQNRITCEINAAAIGRTAEVLVDGPAERGEGLMTGKSRQNKQVVFPGSPDLAGRLVTVKLLEPHLWGFHGERAG